MNYCTNPNNKTRWKPLLKEEVCERTDPRYRVTRSDSAPYGMDDPIFIGVNVGYRAGTSGKSSSGWAHQLPVSQFQRVAGKCLIQSARSDVLQGVIQTDVEIPNQLKVSFLTETLLIPLYQRKRQQT